MILRSLRSKRNDQWSLTSLNFFGTALYGSTWHGHFASAQEVLSLRHRNAAWGHTFYAWRWVTMADSADLWCWSGDRLRFFSIYFWWCPKTKTTINFYKYTESFVDHLLLRSSTGTHVYFTGIVLRGSAEKPQPCFVLYIHNHPYTYTSYINLYS